ncbi:MAG: hypothetical protein NTZ74_07755 [Chloroflexi bacterium]|nr:hypothetical protein [Chloroflexota bacterium]
MTFHLDYHLFVNIALKKLVVSIIACFQPVYDPGNFHYSQYTEPFILQITCQKWGDIGRVVCSEAQAGKTELRFDPPQVITPDVAIANEKLIREECLGSRGKLAELFGQDDIFLATLAEALYEKRMDRQKEFITWLLDRLQIFGFRDLGSPFLSVNSASTDKIDQHFDFPIQGTPAQLGVMIRQFTTLLRSQTEYQKLLCHVSLPGNKDTIQIPSDANPVEVKIVLAKDQMTINAHLLPSAGSLLRVQLRGEKTVWLIWDKIRDELEKLGWFTLPEIPEPSKSVEIKVEPQQIETSTPVEVWLMIPNVGANRDIVRLWHQGLTCGQIATRVGLTKKTILNRINSLRKEYGIQIVPYRKSNFIDNPKDIPV